MLSDKAVLKIQAHLVGLVLKIQAHLVGLGTEASICLSPAENCVKT